MFVRYWVQWDVRKFVIVRSTRVIHERSSNTKITEKFSMNPTSNDDMHLFLSVYEKSEKFGRNRESHRWLLIASSSLAAITLTIDLIPRIRIRCIIVHIWTQNHVFSEADPYHIQNARYLAMSSSTTSDHFWVNEDTLW